MVTVLRWFAKFFLGEAAKEVFRKLLMIVAFNIALLYFVSWLSSHTFAGLSFFGVGDDVAGLLGALPEFIIFIVKYFNLLTGMYLILNAYLFRFAFKLQIAAMKAS